MAEAHHFSVFLFVVGYGDGAFMALRNVSAVVAEDSLGVAFFIYDNSDFFSLLEIFSYGFIG